MNSRSKTSRPGSALLEGIAEQLEISVERRNGVPVEVEVSPVSVSVELHPANFGVTWATAPRMLYRGEGVVRSADGAVSKLRFSISGTELRCGVAPSWEMLEL